MERKNLILVSTFLSGSAALIYQILWFKELYLTFGVGYVALATILCSFLIGLVFGNFFGGKIAERLEDSSKVAKYYCFIEIAIAFSAISIPLINSKLFILLSFFYNSYSHFVFNILQFFISVLLFLIPCTLIGATFPFIFRIYHQDRTNLKNDFSKIYFWNNFGAAFGVILCGFFLIKTLGITKSIYFSAFFNLLAALFIYLGNFGHSVINSPTLSSDKVPKNLLFLFFISGFVSFSLEIIWSRFLAVHYFSTIYSTTLLIFTILIGFSIGSLYFNKFIKNISLNYFSFTFLILSGLIIFSFIISNYSLTFFGRGFGSNVFQILLSSVILVFPASFLLGISFSILVSYSLQYVSPLSIGLGKIYSINLIGGITGILITSFLFIPTIGVRNSLILLSLLLILISLFYRVLTYHRSFYFIFVSLFLILAIFFIQSSNYPNYFEKEYSELFYSEGRSSTVSVIEYSEPYGASKLLLSDGQPVSSNSKVSILDSMSLAYIPLTLHENPKNALTVGFGSGGTSKMMLLYGLDYVDAIEIEPEVIQASKYFSDINGDVLEDPRLSVIIDDARSYLYLTNKTYDVISTDVTNLRYAGNSNLYTKEYFEIIKSKLNENGIVAVWVPIFDVNQEDQKVLVASFADTFTHVSVWYPYHKISNYYVYIGSEKNLEIDYSRLLEVFSNNNLTKSFELIDLNPQRFVNSLVLDDSSVREYSSGSKIHTDDKPILAFQRIFPGISSFTPAENMKNFFDRKIDSLIYVSFTDGLDEQFIKKVHDEEDIYLKPLLFADYSYARGDFMTAKEIYNSVFDSPYAFENALP